MPKNAAIFNYHEKDVLLHVLFEHYPDARKVMEGLIKEFEQTDFNEPLKKGDKKKKTLIDLFLEDGEPEFAPLRSFYRGVGFSLADRSEQENALLEAGAYYAIGKIMLIKCHYRKGLNKLMYASSIPLIPDKFKPLYLFRLGGIYLEQGMMAEAGDTLELASQSCRRYKSDPAMKRLEELILYQILRVFVIQEDFGKAQRIIKALNNITREKDNIIFLSLLGYYYRRKKDFEKAFKVLNRSYSLYKDNHKIKHAFPRQWFDSLYQLSFCCLLNKQLSKAEVLIQEAQESLGDTDFRNRGYCGNLLGQIEIERRGGDLHVALKHFRSAYHHFEKYNDYRNMARSMRSIGWVYFKLNNYPKATQAYNQSLAYDYRTQIKVGILRTLLAKIELRLELVQYNKVEDYLDRIVKLDIPKNHYLQTKVEKYRQILKNKRNPSDEIIGNSPAINNIKEKVLKYSKRSDPVLILGECGVGKNMIAEAIQKESNRSGEYIYVECTTIPVNLMESELFGHMKGSFSGATRTHKGRFEKANGSTIILDEIGDLPLDLQGKLLHFFDKKVIRRVGGSRDIQLDVRVVCVTNKELKKEVAKGNFRKDLYFRINGFVIHIPPLKDRPDDLKALTEHFYIKYCPEFGKHICGIDEDALNYIQEYDWPGNVRELEAVIKRSLDELKDGQPLSKECLEKAIILQDSSEVEMNQEKTPKKPQEQSQEKSEEVSESGDLKSLFRSFDNRLEKLESEKEQKPVRISDQKKALNELFLIIQEENPIRRSQIIERYPKLGKSFHHWIRILKDKYQVIDVEKTQTHLLYKPVADSILKSKEKKGILLNSEKNYQLV